jgi:hypothetical protein
LNTKRILTTLTVPSFSSFVCSSPPILSS